jgi:hypothetical protein
MARPQWQRSGGPVVHPGGSFYYYRLISGQHHGRTGEKLEEKNCEQREKEWKNRRDAVDVRAVPLEDITLHTVSEHEA